MDREKRAGIALVGVGFDICIMTNMIGRAFIGGSPRNTVAGKYTINVSCVCQQSSIFQSLKNEIFQSWDEA